MAATAIRPETQPVEIVAPHQFSSVISEDSSEPGIDPTEPPYAEWSRQGWILANNRHPHRLRRIMFKSPSEYSFLKERTVQAAAHGEWQGLHALMLTLLVLDRPSEVKELYHEYCSQTRKVQGIDLNKRFSSIRSERLQSRISGEGIRSLVHAFIGACTLDGHLDSNDMLSTLNSNLDVLVNIPKYSKVVQTILSEMPDGQNLRHTFLENVRKLGIARLCHHPISLDRAILSLAGHARFDSLQELYDDVMDASIGEDKFVEPWDLSIVRYENEQNHIPLTRSSWERFIHAFQEAGRPEALMKMLDEDMLIRGIKPDVKMLAYVMIALTHIAQNGPDDGITRANALQQSNVIWARLCSLGVDTEDGPLYARIRCLSLLNQDEEIIKRYEQAVSSGFENYGPMTLRAFVRVFAEMRDYTTSTTLLSVTATKHSFQNISRAFNIFLFVLLRRTKITPEVESAFRMSVNIIQSKTIIRPVGLGLILAYLLQNGNPVENSVSSIMIGIDKSRWFGRIAGWYNLILALLKRNRRNYFPSEQDALAGILILEELSRRKNKVEGIGPRPIMDIWSLYCREIIRSPFVSITIRSSLLQRALDSFTLIEVVERRKLHIDILHSMLRNHIQDIDELWGWYRYVCDTGQCKNYPVSIAKGMMEKCKGKPEMIYGLMKDMEFGMFGFKLRRTAIKAMSENNENEKDSSIVMMEMGEVKEDNISEEKNLDPSILDDDDDDDHEDTISLQDIEDEEEMLIVDDEILEKENVNIPEDLDGDVEETQEDKVEDQWGRDENKEFEEKDQVDEKVLEEYEPDEFRGKRFGLRTNRQKETHGKVEDQWERDEVQEIEEKIQVDETVLERYERDQFRGRGFGLRTNRKKETQDGKVGDQWERDENEEFEEKTLVDEKVLEEYEPDEFRGKRFGLRTDRKIPRGSLIKFNKNTKSENRAIPAFKVSSKKQNRKWGLRSTK
ncbi:hypothetical protein M231_03254 [Tremella mesenterica]|uniref:Uncharacterized protein n=1 Tax=Tremella mesenterica TaxID=5217 RepID=A0A4Q1BNH9_TREME|nr:hypothetical protein M231_03254 [Tremella mesenterica]